VKLLALSSSPRRDGNSRILADAVLDGAREQGHATELVHVDDHVSAFVRDCRRCRGADGRCTIGDGFEALLYDHVLPADGLVFATPIYWYGMSGQLKTFLDRLFCYIAASHPGAEDVVSGLLDKPLALVLSSEETYPGAGAGIVHQVQEYARYTQSPLVGVVRGIGNRRGDVAHDPASPVVRARELGAGLFGAHYTDYRLDSPRPGSVWLPQSG
jgi:multimeric flavodoxin WrbA